jgi:hypothetical protein
MVDYGWIADAEHKWTTGGVLRNHLPTLLLGAAVLLVVSTADRKVTGSCSCCQQSTMLQTKATYSCCQRLSASDFP